MARADVETFGLLNRWPIIMHEDRWRFNQINGAGVQQSTCTTNAIYIQFERDYIAGAINRSVYLAAEYLGFLPVPTYIEDEIVQLDLSAAWDEQDLQLKYGYLSTIGRQLTLEIEAGAEVVYSDTNSDSVEDLASITVQAASTPIDEIRVFFRQADGAESEAHPNWEIDQLTRKDNGNGTVTLIGHKSLFAHPTNVWAKEYTTTGTKNKHSGDTADDGAFVAEVDVYRIYSDSDQKVTLVQEDGQEVEVCGKPKDSKYASFALAKLSDSDPTPEYPLYARVSYVAGYPLVRGLMDRMLETALIRYANVEMPQDVKFCDRTAAMWENDRKFSETISQAEVEENPPPFGVTNAGLELARVVEPIALKFKGRERRSYPNAAKERYLKS